MMTQFFVQAIRRTRAHLLQKGKWKAVNGTSVSMDRGNNKGGIWKKK
jgi:hypothetical protein